MNYFKCKRTQTKNNTEKEEEENVLQQTKLNKEMIMHLEKLNKQFMDCKIFVDDLQKLIQEINNLIEYLGIYDVIFIPFIGQPNAGKSTIINSIIGKNILPIGLNECTKRGIIIKYWNKEEPYISKAYFKKEKFHDRTYYYFEEKKKSNWLWRKSSEANIKWLK